MGWIFSKKEEVDTKIGRVHSMLHNSFSKLRYDIHIMMQWLQHFHRKNQEMEERIARLEQVAHYPHRQEDIERVVDRKAFEQEKRIMQLERKVQEPSLTHEEMRRYVDRYYDQEELLQRLERIHDRLRLIESRNVGEIDPAKMEHIHKRLEALETKKQDVKRNLRDKIVAKITKNSKDYIKNIIISLIRKYESITGLQLKEMVVEEQGLCSKSSFYRMLNEIEQLDDINVVWEGKEKRYFVKALKNV